MARQCKYLEGDNVKPNTKAEADALKSKFVRYLRECDIDKSGRGYYFPRSGIVEGAVGREIIIDGSYISRSSLRELTIVPEQAGESERD